MDCPALVPSNTGNDSQQIHNQTCTKKSPAITRERETTLITQEFDPSSRN